MLSPVHGSLRRVQAEFPLRPTVQISRASSQRANPRASPKIGTQLDCPGPDKIKAAELIAGRLNNCRYQLQPKCEMTGARLIKVNIAATTPMTQIKPLRREVVAVVELFIDFLR
jgi:hypothetical protein